MQNKTKRHIVGAVSLSALALGMIASMDAAAAIATTGIATTRHNLGTSNRVLTSGNTVYVTTPSGLARESDLYSNGTDEICVFCHTPHGAQPTATLNMPLWNKNVTTATYAVYTSGTMQGTAVMGGGAQPSLACLSCHDGTQAMDNMVNAPGGSGYNAGGARMAGAWSNLTDTTNGIMQSAAGVVMLGTDLSNDHPIGMAYCGGGQSDGTAGSNVGCADLDFYGMTGSGTTWTVGTGTLQREKMRLYGTAPGTATVECGSCHDPHNAVNTVFLRTSNAGSGVCLSCHVK